MSRVAKAPVSVPSNIEVTLNGNEVTVKGPKGSLTEKLNTLVSVKQDKGEVNQLLFAPATNAPTAWAQAGTARALVNNMVMGVTEGFSKTLELIGVGYRAQAKPKSITLSLGFSHPVEYKLPEGVTAESTSNTTLVLSSTDKRLLGQVAAEIRSFRPPEPYKGKGIRYLGEQISRKEAKKK